MESKFNNVNTTLDIGETWTGEAEVCNGFIIILVDIKSSEPCSIIVRQSDNESNYNFEKTIEYLPLTGGARYQVYRNSFYCYVQVVNTSGNVIPDLIIRTHFLNIGRDPTIFDPLIVAGAVEVLNPMKAFDYVNEVAREVACDNTGQLLITHTPTGVQDVLVTNDVRVRGQNNNFEFFPTPANNTSTIYADGTAGVNVAGGWSYSNLATGKINWYCYASPGVSTDYKVSQLNSMYAVVNNKSTLGLELAQNPWIMIYTRPDSGTNGAGWYKSKLFFGSNAFTDVQGVKLLYTGADSVDIHPEITGTNRIQLLFVEALSTKPLLDALNENIMLGSLQTTNNTSQVGAFNFVMEEFGIDWVKESSVLPIEFNKVQADVTGSSVIVSSGGITETNSGTISSTLTSLNGKVTACNTGAVVVSSQPHLSYLTDNIAVSTMPALAFSTDKVDVTGSSVVVSTLPSIPTGSNVIGGVTTSHTTSSVVAWSNSTYLISFDSGNTVQQIKGSAGSLHSLSITNDNNTLSYVALYDALAINVTAGTTTPVAVFVINKNQQIQLPLHSVEFTTAISFFSATVYGGGIGQTSVYLTASYND